MALTAAVDSFTDQTKRNITSVLRMRGMLAKDAAKQMGMSEATFSQRLNGGSRWLAVEIQGLADILEVDPGVLLAQDEQTFRRRLSTSARLSHARLVGLPSTRDGRSSTRRNSPLLAVVASPSL